MPAHAYQRGKYAHGCTDPIAATDPAMTTPSATSRRIEAPRSRRAAETATGSATVPAGAFNRGTWEAARGLPDE
jgi:hypothetical protein